MFLLPLPAIRPIPYEDGDAYETAEPLRWTEPDGTVGEVEDGFVTDLASVPRPFRTLVPTSGRHTPAAIRHDRRCDDLGVWHRAGRPEHLRPHLSAIEADREFLAGVRELDPNRPLRALVLWAGVRLGAWANPARRDEVHVDAVRVALVLLLVAPLYLPVAVVNALALTLDGLANRAACLLVRRHLAEVVVPEVVSATLPERIAA